LSSASLHHCPTNSFGSVGGAAPALPMPNRTIPRIVIACSRFRRNNHLHCFPLLSLYRYESPRDAHTIGRPGASRLRPIGRPGNPPKRPPKVARRWQFPFLPPSYFSGISRLFFAIFAKVAPSSEEVPVKREGGEGGKLLWGPTRMAYPWARAAGGSITSRLGTRP